MRTMVRGRALPFTVLSLVLALTCGALALSGGDGGQWLGGRRGRQRLYHPHGHERLDGDQRQLRQWRGNAHVLTSQEGCAPGEGGDASVALTLIRRSSGKAGASSKAPALPRDRTPWLQR